MRQVKRKIFNDGVMVDNVIKEEKEMKKHGHKGLLGDLEAAAEGEDIEVIKYKRVLDDISRIENDPQYQRTVVRYSTYGRVDTDSERVLKSLYEQKEEYERELGDRLNQ